MPGCFGSPQWNVCQPSSRLNRTERPAGVHAFTEAGFESQKRRLPAGAVATLKAGGCRRYAAKRYAAWAKRASDGASVWRSCTTNFW